MIQEYFNKNYDCWDIFIFVIVVVSIWVEELVFELQIKIKLGLSDMGLEGLIVCIFVINFVKEKLDNFFYCNLDIVKVLEKCIKQLEWECKEIVGIKKLAN